MLLMKVIIVVAVAVGKKKSSLSQLIRVMVSGQILGVYVMNVKRNKGKEEIKHEKSKRKNVKSK